MKRLLSCLLCLTILIGSISYCSPKAKAVAVVDDLALAEAVTAAYLTSTGIELSVTAGGASAVTSGIAAAAGEYAAATGAAASGEAFLGTVAAGTAISTAGAIVLTAAAAAAVGALAYWVYQTYLIDIQGSVIEGSIPIYQDSASMFLLSDGTVFEMGYRGHSGTVFEFGVTYVTQAGSSWCVELDKVNKCAYIACSSVDGAFYIAYNNFKYGWSSLGSTYQLSNMVDGKAVDYLCFYSGGIVFDGNYGTDDDYKSVPASGIIPLSDADSDITIGSLSIQGDAYSPIPEIPDTQQMVIDVGAPAGATLEDLAQSIPEQVASNTLNVTYTIVSPDEGTEGDGSEIDSDPVPTEIPSWVPDWFGRIITTIQALPQSIADKFSSILGSIKSSIDALAESIAEGIKNLFEPDPDLVTEITTAFTDKFSWLETVHQFGEDLFGMTAESSPPVIYIHLEDAEGRYIYGGTEKALDLSWYQRYKADVDGILSGFMWIAFLWLVFKRASAIIQGGEMITEYTNDLDEGHRSRRH